LPPSTRTSSGGASIGGSIPVPALLGSWAGGGGGALPQQCDSVANNKCKYWNERKSNATVNRRGVALVMLHASPRQL